MQFCRNLDIEIPSRHGLPHLGHPTQKYSMNWEVDQAGLGWLSLGNYFGYSTVLIKTRTANKKLTSFFKLQVAFHENVVGLVEAFYDNSATHLVYNYHGFAVNFSQVSSTPSVHFSETDLASICRSALRGLRYIHEQLLIAHGRIDCDNIILCSNGVIKIGKFYIQLYFKDRN
jgi:serine/threonine protein kinase